MSDNLPPGVSPRDIDKAAGVIPNRDHEHEWEPADYEDPFVLEDGAAYFMFVCVWEPTKSVNMGKHGTEYVPTGPQCEDEQRVRLETDASDEAVEYVEMTYWSHELEVLEIDPPEVGGDGGRVLVKADEHEVEYTNE